MLVGKYKPSRSLAWFEAQRKHMIWIKHYFFSLYKRQPTTDKLHHVWGEKMFWFLSRESCAVHEGCKHLERHLYSNFISHFVWFWCKYPAQDWDRDKSWSLCAHAQRTDMHSESLYAELIGNVAKTCRYAANNAKRWLKICSPTRPLPSKDDSGLALCTEM